MGGVEVTFQSLLYSELDGSKWSSSRIGYFHSKKNFPVLLYRGADKSLARQGRKQARKHVRDSRDFNNIETRAVIKFVFRQDKAPKEIDNILTETLGCLFLGQAKNLSAPLYTKLRDTQWRSIDP